MLHHKLHRILGRYPTFAVLLLALIVSLWPGAVRAQDERRDRSDRSNGYGNNDRSEFRFDLHTQISRTDTGYLYEYTLRQVDYGRLNYEELVLFSLIFPCGEKGYRSARDLRLGGWSVEDAGYSAEPGLRGQAWEIRLRPGFRLTPDGDGSPRGERAFTFSFVSDCAPTRGQWIARGAQISDRGDLDLPCDCGKAAGQGESRDRIDRDRDRDYANREPDRDRDRDFSRPQPGQITVTKREITIATNTVLKLRMQSRLSSATAKVGGRFKAILSEDIIADNLRVVPSGSQVEGHVTSVVPAQRGSKSGTLGITFDRLILPSGRAVPVVGELTSLKPEERRQIDSEGRVEGSSTKRTVVFVGGGAAGGAAIGAIAGGGKGAGIGAAVGAGLGVLGVLFSRGQEAVVEPGTEFGLYLTEPLRIPNAGIRAGSDSSRFTDNDYRTVYDDTDTIYRAQVRLRELGYLKAAPIGRINPPRRRAIIRYQIDNGLRPTGRIDYPTAITLGIKI